MPLARAALFRDLRDERVLVLGGPTAGVASAGPASPLCPFSFLLQRPRAGEGPAAASGGGPPGQQPAAGGEEEAGDAGGPGAETPEAGPAADEGTGHGGGAQAGPAREACCPGQQPPAHPCHVQLECLVPRHPWLTRSLPSEGHLTTVVYVVGRSGLCGVAWCPRHPPQKSVRLRASKADSWRLSQAVLLSWDARGVLESQQRLPLWDSEGPGVGPSGWPSSDPVLLARGRAGACADLSSLLQSGSVLPWVVGGGSLLFLQ